MYRRGPCQRNEYLVLPAGKYTPVCEVNPCRNDGTVLFNGKCYRLGMRGPCINRHTSDVVQVNETTLEVGCVAQRRYTSPMLGLANRFQEELLGDGCPLGSRRKYDNKCSDKKVRYWPAKTACGENEHIYEGRTRDERICDCKPGFIFYPDTKSCYSAFEQGPCEAGKVLKVNLDTIECIETGCEERKVKYQDECYQLGSKGPCSGNEIVTVNVTSLEISCTEQVLSDNWDNAQSIENISSCPRGGKREKCTQ